MFGQFSSLLSRSVQKSDEGTYECQISTKMKMSYSIQLKVVGECKYFTRQGLSNSHKLWIWQDSYTKNNRSAQQQTGLSNSSSIFVMAKKADALFCWSYICCPFLFAFLLFPLKTVHDATFIYYAFWEGKVNAMFAESVCSCCCLGKCSLSSSSIYAQSLRLLCGRHIRFRNLDSYGPAPLKNFININFTWSA